MIILGVDGGGSKTHALAVNEHGEVLGIGQGSASGYHSLGIDHSMTVIRDTIKQALGDQQPDYAVFCLACCDSPNDESRLTQGIEKVGITPQFALLNDTFAAFRAGTSHTYGAAIICGTGINACAIAPDGRMAKFYSLGSLTGDWGGGYSLGEAACGAIYRADDMRGEPTMLTDMVMKALGETSLAVLADRITDKKLLHDEIATLSPLVFQAADAGDKVARDIIIRLGDEIGVTAISMMCKLDMLNLELDLVLAGAVMYGQGPLLMDTVNTKVLRANPRTNIKRLRVRPVVGAALLAYDALGLPAPESLQEMPDLRPHA
jgi:N-acetylglucosamine kinase-like BadF-type ATPase